jgi:hypothetical protein
MCLGYRFLAMAASSGFHVTIYLKRFGNYHGLRYYLSICLEELWKTMKNLRIADVPTEIQTEHLPNTSLECYHYTNLLSLNVIDLMLNFQTKDGIHVSK